MSSSTSAWEPPLPEDLQRMLPQYEITGILGRGGMGAVYRGRQAKLDREVAIKVLPEIFTKGEDELNFSKRFEQEARAMAKLDHPAIISVYDFGETAEGQLYIVMEFIDGMDIHQYLKHHGGKLPQESALAITAHVLDALDYAHNHGIVHRDIKPANILLNHEGRVKIADFGLAKKLNAAGGDSVPALTMSNVAVGTPDFVAPEALDSDQVPDHRADLYAVGVMLYQMLTGKLPRGNYQIPSEMNSEIDPRLDDIVSQAMAANPDYRYATAAAMRADLDVIFSQPFARVEAGEKSGKVAAVVPVTSSVKGRKGVKPAKESSKLAVFLGMGAAVAVVVGIVVMATRGGKDVSEGEVVLEPAVTAVEEKVVPASPPASPPVSSPVSSEVERKAEPGQASIAETPKEVTAENTANGGPGRMREVAPPVSQEESPAAGVPAMVTAEPAPAETPPVAAMPMPKEQGTASPTPNQEPGTRNEELATIPGLQTRLDAYLSARKGETGALATKYLKALEARLGQAADARDLPLATAFRDEKVRVEALQVSLAESSGDALAAVKEGADLPALSDEAPEPLVALRRVWEGEREKIRADLDGKLEVSLKTLEGELTQARQLDEAQAVLAFRESLEQKGGEGASVADLTEVGANVPPASVPGPVASATAPGLTTPATGELAAATKDMPFENSLGMKFVPVPGTEVLFCIHETRWKDFAVYAEENPGIAPNWRNQNFEGFTIAERPGDHPVVNVTWDQAQAFCEWISREESRTYRLPTDREWSIAVGIGGEEKWGRDSTPETVSKPDDFFPWGKDWPPPLGAGNYSDESRRAKAPTSDASYVDGYDDGYPTTAPVMSFAPNKNGLFDLGGNVFEWCEDWWNTSNELGVLRGGAWSMSTRATLLSSYRHRYAPDLRHHTRGFRVVLELAPPQSPPSAPAEITPGTPDSSVFPLPVPQRPAIVGRLEVHRRDGKAVGSQPDDNALANLPSDLGNEVVTISVGHSNRDEHSVACALLADGSVRLWSSGLSVVDLSSANEGLENIIAIAAGELRFLFLDEAGAAFALGSPFGAASRAKPIPLKERGVALGLNSKAGYVLSADGTITNVNEIGSVTPDPSVRYTAIAASPLAALGTDGHWRVQNVEEGGPFHLIPSGGILGAPTAGSARVGWINGSGRPTGVYNTGHAFFESSRFKEIRSASAIYFGPSFFAVESGSGRWTVADERNDSAAIERKLRGCSAIATSSVYFFGIRPLGQ